MSMLKECDELLNEVNEEIKSNTNSRKKKRRVSSNT